MGDVGLMGMHVPGMSWREMREAACLAEELGYSCITMGESWGEDALTSLAQLAAVTSRIRIGTSIVPVFARSPANLAMTALNMDRMSGGRFFLGLGTSGRLVIEDFHGEKFAKPLTRMREYIDIVPDREAIARYGLTVRDVHDVHVWTLTSGMEVGTAHLSVDAGTDSGAVLSAARRLLADGHGLPHFTLQVEPPGARTGCRELSW